MTGDVPQAGPVIPFCAAALGGAPAKCAVMADYLAPPFVGHRQLGHQWPSNRHHQSAKITWSFRTLACLLIGLIHSVALCQNGLNFSKCPDYITAGTFLL